MFIEVTNGKLEYIGALNPTNKIELRSADVSAVGATISQSGAKKASHLKMTIPISRSELGTRRVAQVQLNGSQMRELYETLSKFYSAQVEAGNV